MYRPRSTSSGRLLGRHRCGLRQMTAYTLSGKVNLSFMPLLNFLYFVRVSRVYSSPFPRTAMRVNAAS